MPYLKTAGTPRMYYRTYGPTGAYPVVLIHPIGGNIEIWEEEIRMIRRRGFRVVAYELRGHNRSGMGKVQAYSMSDLVGDLHALLNRLAIKKCTLVGHSIGGQISCIYAATYPKRVDSLIVISSSSEVIPDADLEKHHETRSIAKTKGMAALAMETMGEHAVARKAFRDKEKRRTFERIFTRTSPEGFAGATVALYSIPEDTTELLKKHGFKIYGIVGRDDEVFVRLMRRMRKGIPGMKIKVLRGGDHWIIIENHRVFDKALGWALDGALGRSQAAC